MAAKEISGSKLLKLAQKFNNFYLSGFEKGDCRPFFVGNCQVGLVRPDVTNHLLKYPEIFLVQPHAVVLNPAFRDYSERSTQVEKFLRECRSTNTFITLKGWRDESYEVRPSFCHEPLLKMERSATCLFGVCNYGVDINGYVMDKEKGLCLWLQRRSPTKQTWPGKWDNMVGGGLSCGYSVLETAHKEAEEEASIPRELLANLKSGGCVSFYFESERGLFPNTEFVFDLELPVDFIPTNNDGEVDKFELLPAKEVLERCFTPDFKTTSCPVVLDFLIRHGEISPEKEPNFLELVELLHVPLQGIYRRFPQPVNENGRNETE
nr:PREDICTED: uncharacterized protein YJR142W [Bemisia tabaci]